MKVLNIILFAIAGLLIGGAFFYLYKKSQVPPTIYQTEQAETGDIVKKTVATGSITPRKSVDIKPKVTGVLTELYVDAGAKVKLGDPLGKISIIADVQAVNQADSSVRSAQISYDNAKRELDRNEALAKQGIVADAELQTYRTNFALAKQTLDSAGANAQIVKEGATKTQGKTSTLIVTATAEGMVIDVPVKVGYFVINANSFNPGTTIATIANMDDMIFDGHVDEAEVAKIKEGMKLQIKVGAIEGDKFEGTLEFIAPQGKELDGAIQFEIKAAIKQQTGAYIRAGYSANADIVLDEKKGVLEIREALVQYDKDGKSFVEVETAKPQVFERRDVKLGLSDGIKSEVLSGVTKDDKIKIPDNAGPAGMGSGSGAGAKAPPPPPRK
ncbi:MAG TPA: efflux RND transporter periplasmic adaptor subunit [Kofleriaceae bacterium]|jgi:HlyD family secretion protein